MRVVSLLPSLIILHRLIRPCILLWILRYQMPTSIAPVAEIVAVVAVRVVASADVVDVFASEAVGWLAELEDAEEEDQQHLDQPAEEPVEPRRCRPDALHTNNIIFHHVRQSLSACPSKPIGLAYQCVNEGSGWGLLVDYQLMIAARSFVWANALFRRPYAAFAKPPIRKHKDKFKLDYEYFSNVPVSQREEELDRIKKTKNLKQQLIKDIPKFPNNEIWDYHGTKLMTYLWEPACKPKAIVIFFHSLNGHIGMCGELARQLASRGIVMAGYDFKNFGQSEGPNRGMLQSFDQLVSTSQQFVIKMKTKYPGTKVFLCGMSLGGAVAFHISIKNHNLAQGNIFMSPSIRENKLHFPMLKKMTILLSMAFPKVQLLKSKGRNASKYKLDEISKNDPYLYHGRLWVKTVQQILFAMGKTKKMYKQLTTPYLLVQSGCDKLVDPFACLDLEQQSPSKDKTTVIINDMWHAVWFDDHVYDVIKIIDEWLQERI